MDATFQIITASATHAAMDPKGLHLGGELVAVYPRVSEAATLNSRVGFGHIDGVPVDNIDELVFLLEPNEDELGNIISRSKWRVNSLLMTTEEMMMVVNTNMLEATWARFKEVCINVVTGLNLTDGDIP